MEKKKPVLSTKTDFFSCKTCGAKFAAKEEAVKCEGQLVSRKFANDTVVQFENKLVPGEFLLGKIVRVVYAPKTHQLRYIILINQAVAQKLGINGSQPVAIGEFPEDKVKAA